MSLAKTSCVRQVKEVVVAIRDINSSNTGADVFCNNLLNASFAKAER